MITLPPDLHPSKLLHLDGIPDFVLELLRTSRASRADRRWNAAEQSARSALDGSQQAGTQVSRGAAMVHLADVYLATARTGLALREARAAYWLFAAQPSRYQRHNEGIAAYQLGLVHQAQGDRVEALSWYEKSMKLLDGVILAWSTINAKSRVRCCKRTRQWLETLAECLTDAETATSAASHTSLWLPLITSDTEPMFALARLEVKRYIVACEMELAGQTFEIELLDGPTSPSLPSESDCYALRIPKQALELLDADEGDYAVVVRHADADREGPGVLETLSGAEFGNFRRDPSGRISFVRPDATVIGGEAIGDDFPVGYVTALLRRA